jgi:hypothetical protein
MHVSRADLPAMAFGEYENRTTDSGGMRIAFESMPVGFPPDGPDEVVHAGEAYHLRPGHFVQTLEPVGLIELSPVEEHDRTRAAVARNRGLVTS